MKENEGKERKTRKRKTKATIKATGEEKADCSRLHVQEQEIKNIPYVVIRLLTTAEVEMVHTKTREEQKLRSIGEKSSKSNCENS
ncbi:Hypothetical predicted protein [Octopus vulgaris]|uniref:Uncharacterized protein n=1 Tax=Octopus vulgaris TaxID=6645 RepID=A0AA36BCC2_OCTVU|nr:Hypothetical predicted protein [Octopus vulgaris]